MLLRVWLNDFVVYLNYNTFRIRSSEGLHENRRGNSENDRHTESTMRVTIKTKDTSPPIKPNRILIRSFSQQPLDDTSSGIYRVDAIRVFRISVDIHKFY